MINRVTGVTLPGNGRRTQTTRPATLPPARRPPAPPGDLGERIGTFLGDHPVLSLALGLSLGIAVGCLLKRR